MFAMGLPTRLFKSLALWLALPLRIALFLLCFTPVATYASQLTFNKTVTPDDIQFKYRWLDNEGTEQTIAFSLPNSALKVAPTTQANYKPEIAQRYVAAEPVRQTDEARGRRAGQRQ